MGLSVLPSEILAKRMALLRAFLGQGWLRSAWTDAPAGECGVHTWGQLERRYGQLVCWLEPGLEYVCRLGSGSSDATSDTNSDVRDLAAVDTPVALVQVLRDGLVVSPSGIRTFCKISARDLLEGIVPLLAWLYCLHDRRVAGGLGKPGLSRCLVLLAGIPGSGKSVVGGLLESFCRLLKGFPEIQVAGMDGWHLRNRSMASRRITDERGQVVPLLERKGSPESFDLKALTSDVQRLVRYASAPRLPVYDRRTHEPVESEVVVAAPIVVLEGNYLLLWAQGWEKLAELACGSVWLDVPVRVAAASTMSRHMTGGRSREEAQSKWARNDWPNAMVALRGRPRADAAIYMDAVRRLRFVHRP